MIKIFFKWTLFKKLNLSFLVGALLPFSLMFYYVSNLAELELKNSLNEKYYLITSNIIQKLEQKILYTWLKNSQILANSVSLEDNVDLNNLANVINSNLKNNNDLLSISLSSTKFSDPIHFLKNQEFKDLNNLNSTFTDSLLNHKINVFSDSEFDIIDLEQKFNKNDIYVIIDFIKQTQKKDKYKFRAIYRLKDLSEMFKSSFNNDNIEIYILNNSESLIYSSVEINNFKSYHLEDAIKQIKKNDHVQFKIDNFEINAEKYISYYSKIAISNWVLIIVDKYSNAYFIVEQMQQKFIFWISLLIIISTIIALYISKNISSPILELSTISSKIAQGKYDLEIKYHSKDELGVLTNSFRNMLNALKEKELMGHFISESTAKMITSKSEYLTSKVERKELTFFFSDIRQFTNYAEKNTPEQVIAMLNSFLNVQVNVMEKYEGEIDKFIGDEIFAIFYGQNAELRAVKCAIQIQKDVEKLRKSLKEDVHIGIGIHSGLAVMGTVGVSKRFDHTVIGNNVNIASRLCKLAKNEQILVSSAIANKCDTFIKLEDEQKINVKGLEEEISTFNINFKNHEGL